MVRQVPLDEHAGMRRLHRMLARSVHERVVRCEEVAIEYDARFVQRSYERAAATDAPERCTQEYQEFVGVESFPSLVD